MRWSADDPLESLLNRSLVLDAGIAASIDFPFPARFVDRLAEKFLAFIAEHALSLVVGDRDPALGINDHHRVRRRFEHGPEERAGVVEPLGSGSAQKTEHREWSSGQYSV